MATRDIVQQTIDTLHEAVDETKKTDSVRRIERILDRVDTEILDAEIITGLDDLQDAIEDYKGIERTGLTPEEYQDEKEAAFEAIQEAVDGLDIDEGALKDVANEETPPAKIKQTVPEMEAMYSRQQIKEMALKKGLDVTGSKRNIIRRIVKSKR